MPNSQAKSLKPATCEWQTVISLKLLKHECNEVQESIVFPRVVMSQRAMQWIIKRKVIEEFERKRDLIMIITTEKANKLQRLKCKLKEIKKIKNIK